MFLFIGGIQPKTIRLSDAARNCPACGVMSLYQKRQDQYFSLFFLPLFRVKKGPEILKCESCSTITDSFDIQSRTKKQNTCAVCGKPVEPDFLYCPYCRTALKK